MLVPNAGKQGEKILTKIVKKMLETVRPFTTERSSLLSFRQKIKFRRNTVVTSYTVINLNTTKKQPTLAKRGADSANAS